MALQKLLCVKSVCGVCCVCAWSLINLLPVLCTFIFSFVSFTLYFYFVYLIIIATFLPIFVGAACLFLDMCTCRPLPQRTSSSPPSPSAPCVVCGGGGGVGARLDLGGGLAGGTGRLPGFVMSTTRASLYLLLFRLLRLRLLRLLLGLLPLPDYSLLCLQGIAVLVLRRLLLLLLLLPALEATAGHRNRHRNGSRVMGLISALGLVLLHQELCILAGVRRGV